MPDTIKDLGVWQQYTPDKMPDIPGVTADTVLPPGMMFSKGPDGTDWYVFRASWPAATLCAFVDPLDRTKPDGPGTVQSVVWDARLSAVPFGMRVLQITGHDTADQTPWKSYQFSTYDPATGAITPPDQNVTVVSAVQAEIQLSRMLMPDGKTSVFDALQAMLPQAGAETNIWYKRAQNWRIDDPNVQKLGAALGLSAAQMQSAFNDADKIEP